MLCDAQRLSSRQSCSCWVARLPLRAAHAAQCFVSVHMQEQRTPAGTDGRGSGQGNHSSSGSGHSSSGICGSGGGSSGASAQGRHLPVDVRQLVAGHTLIVALVCGALGGALSGAAGHFLLVADLQQAHLHIHIHRLAFLLWSSSDNHNQNTMQLQIGVTHVNPLHKWVTATHTTAALLLVTCACVTCCDVAALPACVVVRARSTVAVLVLGCVWCLLGSLLPCVSVPAQFMRIPRGVAFNSTTTLSAQTTLLSPAIASASNPGLNCIRPAVLSCC